MYSLHLRMYMFGLEGSGFIVSIGLTLLISGVVVYYCNTRLRSIEESVRNQNKVLGDFIASVQEGLIIPPSQENLGNSGAPHELQQMTAQIMPRSNP